jgi:hypothetical protein
MSGDELPLVISFIVGINRELRMTANPTLWSLVHDRHMEGNIFHVVPIVTVLTTGRVIWLL